MFDYIPDGDNSSITVQDIKDGTVIPCIAVNAGSRRTPDNEVADPGTYTATVQVTVAYE